MIAVNILEQSVTSGTLPCAYDTGDGLLQNFEESETIGEGFDDVKTVYFCGRDCVSLIVLQVPLADIRKLEIVR